MAPSTGALSQHQMLHMIGLLFGVLLTGILLTLGIWSICLLSSRSSDGSSTRQNYFLRFYLVTLLLVVLISDIEVFVLEYHFAIFSSRSPREARETLKAWRKVLGSTQLSIGLLSEGVSVWRCLMVQRALGPCCSSKWGNVFWGFPACLWVLTLITGSISAATPNVNDFVYRNVFGAMAVTSNTTLNVYTTLFLTTRLLAHRKMVIAALGDKAPVAQHRQIIEILLESAAINVPISIALAVGLGAARKFIAVIGLMVAPSRALASVIIIHQVALGRAFSQGKEEEFNFPSESSINS